MAALKFSSKSDKGFVLSGVGAGVLLVLLWLLDSPASVLAWATSHISVPVLTFLTVFLTITSRTLGRHLDVSIDTTDRLVAFGDGKVWPLDEVDTFLVVKPLFGSESTLYVSNGSTGAISKLCRCRDVDDARQQVAPLEIAIQSVRHFEIFARVFRLKNLPLWVLILLDVAAFLIGGYLFFGDLSALASAESYAGYVDVLIYGGGFGGFAVYLLAYLLTRDS